MYGIIECMDEYSCCFCRWILNVFSVVTNIARQIYHGQLVNQSNIYNMYNIYIYGYIHGPVSIAMLDYQRVHINQHPVPMHSIPSIIHQGTQQNQDKHLTTMENHHFSWE